MGTVGTYGFKKNGEYKLTMCINSSYYECLGQDVIGFIKEANNLRTLNDIFDKIVMIGIDDYSGGSYEKFFYILESKEKLSIKSYESMQEELDRAEGYLDYYLKDESKYMIDEGFFDDYGLPTYKYIIDLDRNVLTVQEGYDEYDEDYRVEDIDLDYIFENYIDLEEYMKNKKEDRLLKTVETTNSVILKFVDNKEDLVITERKTIVKIKTDNKEFSGLVCDVDERGIEVSGEEYITWWDIREIEEVTLNEI